MRYFLQLSYDGTDFHGWQRQPQVISVQECLETSAAKVLKQQVTVMGCGRTDAGVHARSYIAHIEVDQPLPDPFLRKLNYALPEGVAVHRVWESTTDWHARFSAISRTYHYYFHTQKDPFRARFSTHLATVVEELDWDAMQTAAALLPEYTDYRGYCKVPDKHDSTICRVAEAGLVRTANDQFYFQITANRFLRGMVRLLVAQLLDIGRRKQSVTDFATRLRAGERPAHFVFAPPQGLFLHEVGYPDELVSL